MDHTLQRLSPQISRPRVYTRRLSCSQEEITSQTNQGRVHDGRFCDAECVVADGTESRRGGGEEDRESEDVGVEVSCMFQVRRITLAPFNSNYTNAYHSNLSYAAGCVKTPHANSAQVAARPPSSAPPSPSPPLPQPPTPQ